MNYKCQESIPETNDWKDCEFYFSSCRETLYYTHIYDQIVHLMEKRKKEHPEYDYRIMECYITGRDKVILQNFNNKQWDGEGF